jgi:hypothetical protein
MWRNSKFVSRIELRYISKYIAHRAIPMRAHPLPNTMPMYADSVSSVSPAPSAGDYAATIITVKAARDQARAESIRDLVDAHRRLQGTVARFLSSFGASAERVPRTGTPTLERLASELESRARAARFRRMGELKSTLDAVRTAARDRDRLFSDAFGTDAPALRDAALALERLDARLVALGVEQALHASAARRDPSGALTQAEA